MKDQLLMFGGATQSVDDALELTAESLRVYGGGFKHWAIAFSGGKDSSALVAAVVHLLETGRVPPPKSLTVLYADTRLELLPLQISATTIMGALDVRGIKNRVVLPEMDDRFFVYMLGRGVPPPKNRFRWCTPQLKVEPMLKALENLRYEAREKILMLTGVRVGESAARDDRISLACGKDGGECGQGWFQETTPQSIADTLAPILHWRVCNVFDWLWLKSVHGLPTTGVAEGYGAGEEGDEIERNARTGCVGCNLASRDVALERVVKLPQWAYLAPLHRLRPLYAELTKPHNRLRKIGEKKADGTEVSNPGRLGPLTMDARRLALAEVLNIQREINAFATTNQRPFMSLINIDEHARILELIESNQWPNRWTGDEVHGDVILPVMPMRGGGFQHTMAEALEL